MPDIIGTLFNDNPPFFKKGGMLTTSTGQSLNPPTCTLYQRSFYDFHHVIISGVSTILSFYSFVKVDITNFLLFLRILGYR